MAKSTPPPRPPSAGYALVAVDGTLTCVRGDGGT